MTDLAGRACAAWPDLHPAQRTLLLDVLIHGPRSRADLARRTNLSRTTLMRLTRGLVELGLVVEGETETPTGRGRPSEVVHLRPTSAYFVGVKLTGDALYAVVTDLQGRILATRECGLTTHDVSEVVVLIADVVRTFAADFALTAVGVCLAGDVTQRDGRTLLVGSHFLGWENVPLGELVAASTGLPTSISNDVQALTVAHHWFGAGVGCTSLAVIGLGAGIGAGLVVNNELVRGSRGHPGKVGHLSVSNSGPRCDRGHTGCISAFVTIPAILRNSGLSSFQGTIDAATGGDVTADRALRAAGRALGVAVANIADLIDPEKVIVTGEALAVARYAEEDLRIATRERLDPAAEPVVLDVVDFTFADYAWAAAIAGIRHVI